MRSHGCAAMRLGSIMAVLGLMLVVGLLFASVATSKAKPAEGPTAENAQRNRKSHGRWRVMKRMELHAPWRMTGLLSLRLAL
jgi:hypothetical protein